MVVDGYPSSPISSIGLLVLDLSVKNFHHSPCLHMYALWKTERDWVRNCCCLDAVLSHKNVLCFDFNKYSWKLPLCSLKEAIGVQMYSVAIHFFSVHTWELPMFMCKIILTPLTQLLGQLGIVTRGEVSKIWAWFVLGNFLLPPTWIEFNKWVAKRRALCPPFLWAISVEERRLHGDHAKQLQKTSSEKNRGARPCVSGKF